MFILQLHVPSLQSLFYSNEGVWCCAGGGMKIVARVYLCSIGIELKKS